MSQHIQGIGVSKGFAIGKAFVYSREQHEVYEREVSLEEIPDEIARFTDALALASKQLHDIRKKIVKTTPPDILAFIDTHLLMLEDPAFRDGTVHNIRTMSCNAEWALYTQGVRLLQVFDEMEDPYLRTRRDDVLHVINRIQDCLHDTVPEELDTATLSKSIIIADDLTPADTLMIGHNNVAGFVTQFGGPLSHTAILASNLGIPAIVGVHEDIWQIQTGDELIVDGQQGTVYIRPERSALTHYRKLIRGEKQRRTDLKKLRHKPCVTLDGREITLLANIDSHEDIRHIRAQDDAGVGLFRTEMLYIESNEWPGEQFQFEFYRKAVKKLAGKPLTIRTSDLGADKELQETIDHGPLAHNPAMGLRAIRRCLKEPALFLPQVRAILRASAYGDVRMMIPMLTNIEELHDTLMLIDECKQLLRDMNTPFDENIPIGAMIEVPAAALSVNAFADRLDFLSIGTNDLIQYTLALDRIDDEVSHLFNPLHPAVLQLIQLVITAGKRARIPVSMCGEMASDTRYTRLLLGMGLDHFSVQPNALLEIKHIINNSRLNSLRPRVRKVLELYRASDIEKRINALNE